MAVGKRKVTAAQPAHGAKDGGPNERPGPSSANRPCPPEPFEECGPTGGYGGAGTDDEAKERN
jgi:hypothetical protein